MTRVCIKSQMSYKNIIEKLKKGVAIAEKHRKIDEVNKFKNSIEKIAFKSAVSTKQMKDLSGFEGLGEGIIDKLKSGALFPDQLYGWSTKSILATLLVLLLVKLKTMTKGK